jgi:hypothetical protein
MCTPQTERGDAVNIANPRRSRPEKRMPVPPASPQDAQAAIAVLAAIAAGLCVAYWRTVLRVILIALLALAVYGAVVGIHGVSSLMAAHHHQ